jgi:hypothetical protein
MLVTATYIYTVTVSGNVQFCYTCDFQTEIFITIPCSLDNLTENKEAIILTRSSSKGAYSVAPYKAIDKVS